MPRDPVSAAERELDPAPLDAADPLATFRDRFAVPDPDLVYLDGNSLGRPPQGSLDRLARVAGEEWAGELAGAWNHWLDLPLRVGDVLASAALGAARGTVAVTDSTTVNLYRVAAAAPGARPGPGGATSPPTATSSRAWRPRAASRSGGSTATRSKASRCARWSRRSTRMLRSCSCRW